MAKKANYEKLAERKEELADVNKAIRMVLGGAQSYTIGSRSLTRANLAELRKWKKELEDEIATLSGGSGRFRRVVTVS
jgi:uncharacterized protein YdcH (DUF465 family)